MKHFAKFKLSKKEMKKVLGGAGDCPRCPKSLEGGGKKCKDYWGDDEQGEVACYKTCGYGPSFPPPPCNSINPPD